MLKKIDWFINRWRSMEHPQEDFYRLRQAIQLKIIDKWESKGARAVITQFTFINNTPDYDISALQKLIPTDTNHQVFQLYDYKIADITSIKNWRKDYKNNIESPIMFANKIPSQNFNLVGDIRYVSVISRLHHFPCLIAKALAYNDRVLFETVKKQIVEWKAQNPYLYSINWRSGIEVGIRAVNLVYTRKLLELSTDDVTPLKRFIDELLTYHFQYLIKHPSLYSSANNHLIAELMGIFVICTHYEFEKSVEYAKKSFIHLIKELLKQTHEDGFTKEQSTHYHIEVLNAYLTVFACAKDFGMEIPKEAINRLLKMGDFLCLILNKQNKPLQIGDNDEGELLYPYFDEDFSIYGSICTDLSLLQKNAAYFNHYKRFDLRNYFLYGNRGLNQFTNSIQTTELPVKQESQLFPYSGYCFFNEANTRLCFDVGGLGLGKLAAHGHSDLLHFTLEVAGQPFIVDTGTFQYHSHYDHWRNYFRGVYGHNTVAVNGLNQARSGGRMIWLKHPKIDDLKFEKTSTSITCEASHNGFIQQGSHVKHYRKITFDKKFKTYEIQDKLLGKGDYTIDFILHFHPSVRVEHENEKVILINPNNVKVVLKNTYFSNASIIKGNKQLPLGWFSIQFNTKDPTYTLLLKLTVEKTIILKTIVHLES